MSEFARTHDLTPQHLKSPGVLRIEAIASCFTKWHKYALFLGIFIIAYSYGLDGSIRYTFQSYATAEFGANATIATISVVRSIVAAACQPAYAKIADYFGRAVILGIACLLFVLGTIVEATSKGVPQFAGGAMLYQFGYTGIILLVEVLVADTTSMRNRLFFSYIPALPFLINAWVSGNVAGAVMDGPGWQWGVGMWGIIFPVTAIPLFYSLIHAEIRARQKGLLRELPSALKTGDGSSIWLNMFWEMDLLGLLLLAACFSLVLLPFTLAGGIGAVWRTARVIAPLVVGFVVAIPAFLVWEIKFARHPLVPFKLLKDRTVIASLCIAMGLNTAWYLQGAFLYNVLVVSFDKGIIEATRVLSVYSFVSVVIGVCLGLTVRWVRRLKPFIVAGTLLFVLAFGLLIRFRGGNDNGNYIGLIAAEVILGIAGGMFPYPTQAMIQSATQHEHVAVITALYLASYNIGSAIGNTIAGAIWQNTLPKYLLSQLLSRNVPDAASQQMAIFTDPFTFIASYPMGTPERESAVHAYMQTQRLLCITGLCISLLIVVAALSLKNPKLADSQSQPEAEQDSVYSSEAGSLEKKSPRTSQE